ncbi:LysR family transcriptional regulator [Vitiosangium sp. GDMCC 1.1324]|uniref:LysR family transcriptional regulator n=1 Tax=Vitiosangium sp. (strain GDMCC 1.1324) TaxID=2138576 RepID=UPI000D38EA72|nr:LysR family transcriptional regulator [Vitiosangium sp. GDMCC 1.1324]PTL80392.1 LysR family transcriptional regulator [Vitiosangium sp. GDMCC 1.1324]
MDTLGGIEVFVATVRGGSFAAAGRRLGQTASAVSRRVARLEAEMGVQLLARTTRSLRVTEAGAAFFERCVRILDELGEARDAISRSHARPMGRLRVEAPVALGRRVVAPRLPRFLRENPEVQVVLTLRDTTIDPVVEGVDVTLRIGELRDTDLAARRLGECAMVVCASPGYLRAHGVPESIEQLHRHTRLGFIRDGAPMPWRLGEGDGLEPNGALSSNDAETLRTAALEGHGLIYLLDFLVEEELRSGQLVEVLPGLPRPRRPIHALYARSRPPAPRIGVFLDFLQRVLASGRVAPAKDT